MSEREQMLEVIRKAYAARMKGDIDGVMASFHEDVRFQLNAAPTEPQLADFVGGQPDFRSVLKDLTDAYTFNDMEIADSIVEGSKAAISVMVTVTANRTGKTAKTLLLDRFEFKDGKIAAFTQFCDTALAARLLA